MHAKPFSTYSALSLRIASTCFSRSGKKTFRPGGDRQVIESGHVLAQKLGQHVIDRDVVFLQAVAGWIGMMAHRAELFEAHTRMATAQGRLQAGDKRRCVRLVAVVFWAPLRTPAELGRLDSIEPSSSAQSAG